MKMRWIYLITWACMISYILRGQTGITFKIEDLPRPDNLLPQHSYEDIWKRLVTENTVYWKWNLIDSLTGKSENILAKSLAPDSLVHFKYNSFFYGMYSAYADHRPFVLSPDMIWLLITQGFARHIHADPEQLRHHLVDFSGKQKIIISSDLRFNIHSSEDWEQVFPQFTEQIASYGGQDLIHTLTADFTTTTVVEKIASDITIMEAMEPYFEFVVIKIVCGIPEITLQGTPEDWQKVLNKTKELAKYNLEWWTDELEPILEEFVKASKGSVNKRFWRNMFKYHSQKKYGAPKIIDGWIVKFFPYDKYGRRNNLKRLEGGDKLPEEIVKVDVIYKEMNGAIVVNEVMLELWAGFIGLEQDAKSLSLTPKIGWMVKIKDTANYTGLTRELLIKNNHPRNAISIEADCFSMVVTEVPEILNSLPEIFGLHLRFQQDVFIPEWLRYKRIGRLEIDGNVSIPEKKKIINWFPNALLVINGKEYNSGNSDCISILYPPLDSIEKKNLRVLEIINIGIDDTSIPIPEYFKNLRIEHLIIEEREEHSINIQTLKMLLPGTRIYINGKEI